MSKNRIAEINCEKAKDGLSPDIRLTTRGSLRWPRAGRDNAKGHQWQPRTTNAKANKLRIGSINVGTMKGKANEIAETLERKVDICCLQEARKKCDGAELVESKSGRFCTYWSERNVKGQEGLAIYVAEKLENTILTVERISPNFMTVRFRTSSRTLRIYAPQSGRKCKKKDEFYEKFMVELSKDSDDIPLTCGDHVGARNTNYEGVHGNHSYGVLNNKVIRLLNFCIANDLILINTRFVKREQHIINYKSGKTQSQIDFIMYPKNTSRT